MTSPRRIWLLPGLFVLCGLWLSADPIPVKYLQGSARGFLVLKDVHGRRLAVGDVVQTVRGGLVTSRVTFRFRDGSLDDDTTVYSQHGVFRLITDHHIQRGPSFPKPIDALIDVGAGTVSNRSLDRDGKKKLEVQNLDMPPDVSNGMALTLIGNIGSGVPQTRLGYVASSPSKSRLVHLLISPVGLEPLEVAGSRREVMNFVIRVQLGGVAGVVAPIVGKQPDDVHVWLMGGAVPMVVAEEGQLYQDGPVWRIELTSPTWPSPQ